MVINKVSIEDLRKFKFVSDPQVSPDGKKIAFVLSTINYEADAYDRHIWMIDRASGVAEQFTYGDSKDNYPRWSPDGKWLMFLSRGRQPDKKTQAWVIPIDGGEAKLVADSDMGVDSPIWAPDSQRILFTSRVWTDEKPKTDVKVIKEYKYKTKNASFIYGTHVHLFVTNTSGGSPKQLTTGEFDVDAADWSPDGKQIAFVTIMGDDSRYVKEEEGYGLFRDMYLVSSEGGTPNKLTSRGYSIKDISWSPDGKLIAFSGHDMHLGQASNVDVWLLPSQGGTPKNITAPLDRNQRGLGNDCTVGTPWPGAVWSSDSGSIYVLTGGVPTANIYRVDILSEKITQVTSGRNVEGFSISDDNSVLAYTAMDATHLADVWVMDEQGDRQLTWANKELWDELWLSKPEQYKWTNELGDEIDGWIMKPQNFDPTKKYPTILQIHGGPRAIFGDSMYHEFQVLVSEGNIVIYTNPRGSGGYTEAYSAAMFGHSGEYDYNDLMTFVDDALDRFDFIDKERLGVTGGSYGGFMTNWIVTHTNRFKAAVTCRSVSNAYSMQGESDNQYRSTFMEGGKMAYMWTKEGEEALMRQSPIRYAANAKTPILIIHSDNDWRVPIGQAMQFYIALKEVGVETEFVWFPGETHELSRSGKPKHREERLQHIVRWFRKYL